MNAKPPKRKAEKAAPPPTAAELAEYFRDDQARLKLQRRLDDLVEKLKPTKDKITAYVNAAGGANRSTVIRGSRRLGWLCRFVPMGRRLDFKAALIKALGLDKVQKLRDKAPLSYRLVVEPADAPAVS